MIIDELVLLLPDLEGSVTPESRFGADLEMDSLDIVELVARLEKRLGIEIPEALEAVDGTPVAVADGLA